MAGGADAEDLEILSARLQDAAGKLKDFVWLPKQRRFAAVLNRFRWEDGKGQARGCAPACISTACSKVQSQQGQAGRARGGGVAAGDPVHANDGETIPAGVIELVLAGGGAIRLTVECIDAELADLTGPWAARGAPGP